MLARTSPFTSRIHYTSLLNFTHVGGMWLVSYVDVQIAETVHKKFSDHRQVGLC